MENQVFVPFLILDKAGIVFKKHAGCLSNFFVVLNYCPAPAVIHFFYAENRPQK